MKKADDWPEPGSDAERAAYAELCRTIPVLFRVLSADRRAPQCVVVVPSLSLDPRELEKISGVYHYEERMLVNLMLLRQPRTKLVYITSQPLHPIIVNYYLSLLPGVPASHATGRLVMLDCNDRSSLPLSLKILRRPRLMARIRKELEGFPFAHMTCFNSTGYERTLAVRLGLPLYSTDPELMHLGSKSGCRRVFREAGVDFPFGCEDLYTPDEIASALAEVRRHDPAVRLAVVKLNHGFSGEGNALFSYDGLGDGGDLVSQIRARLPSALRYEAMTETWDSYAAKFRDMGGVVETFVGAAGRRSPSVQCRVNAIGEAQVISTHDQLLGGVSGQVFLGCTFPASSAYRLEIQQIGARVAEVLARRGVIGRFGIDLVSIPVGGAWRHYAIEINLRKGGTTHPFLTLKFLTSGRLNCTDGLFYSSSGRAKYYYASDTIQSDRYLGLLPEDLIDLVVYHGLHFHGPTERGVVFHLIGALSEFGKLGLVSIGDSQEEAEEIHRRTLKTLDEETAHDTATFV
ncbi:MAG: carboxylate-amine ligase [Candidatus Schekmanbacteria bacterium]|nr:carboxylate-amine ligase [Candidatus Schekmanbacteria bacterium]